MLKPSEYFFILNEVALNETIFLGRSRGRTVSGRTISGSGIGITAHSFLLWSVRAFDLFVAEAKQAKFNIIKCALWLRRKEQG